MWRGRRLRLKGAVVVVQEIFGVNSQIRGVCDAFAKEGYIGIAPALFDRFERGVELKDTARTCSGRLESFIRS